MANPIPLEFQFEYLAQNRVRDIADYIGLVYQYAVGIAGILAVALIMWGGMKWIFAGGDTGKIGEAKKTISNATIGLILALGSYLLLNTINPNLVNLRVPYLRPIQPIPLTAVGFCPNAGNDLGKYPCGNMYALKGGFTGMPSSAELKKTMEQINSTAGQCQGAACGGGKSCWYSTQVAASGVRAPYLCVDASKCSNTCEGITDKELCDSSACDKLVGKRCWWKDGSCKTRILTGESCGDSAVRLPACGNQGCGALTCADFDSVCDEAGWNKCTKVRTRLSGESCTTNTVCKSGKCVGGPGSTSTLKVAGAAATGIVAGSAILGYVGTATATGAILGTSLGPLGTVAGAGGAAIGAVGYYVYTEYLSSGNCQ